MAGNDMSAPFRLFPVVASGGHTPTLTSRFHFPHGVSDYYDAVYIQGRSHVLCLGGRATTGAPMIANKGAGSQSCLKTASSIMINDMLQ